jgi:hypothetical protein
MVFDSISSPAQYLAHLCQISSQFKYYLISYLIFHFIIFLLNLCRTLILDQCLKIHSYSYSSNLNERTLLIICLVLCFISSIFYITCRHFAYYLSNIYLKRALWKFSIHDLLMNLLDCHPLWLTSSSISGNTLRDTIIEYGIGSLTKCLNRMTYFGPMIFEFVTTLSRLGALHFSLASTFACLLGLLHFQIFLPYSQDCAQRRDQIVKEKRNRYLMIEKIEYSSLQKYRTRFLDSFSLSLSLPP